MRLELLVLVEAFKQLHSLDALNKMSDESRT
jgi:hypothetical protein